ncbi:hypothetical protein LOZ61_001158 [Ophidiomyces ophidiicola]|nr:hypothetical protein LOZ61_001158 [Ophidiomyces ophidiicola]KAI1929475.1 hypothetical protein LOZ60_001689 [Ophidiomyces ophidiicola]KAI2144732.1 hypothetical protein LOZ27_003568 [Ophidiomyces ophidiicola]KAI2419216.1 hypothetical protein LOY90_000354 [Ophidiomyces ophidiicola]
MAFRVPSQIPQRRPSFQNASRSAQSADDAVADALRPRDDDHQEWVLFSPETAHSSVARTHTTSTERTPRTAGRSRLSDFGSLGTALHSGTGDIDLEPEQDDLLEEDATELDSLDDGLHAFREPSAYEPVGDQLAPHQSDPAVLPAHDGLGTFPVSSLQIQEQLWKHEKFNPNRVREATPLQIPPMQQPFGSVEEFQPHDMDLDRWERVEQWRMEQSRFLLQEIEKETRRRRKNRSGHTLQRAGRRSSAATIDSILETQAPADEILSSEEGTSKDSEEEESFWRRITRKVIRELIGIDDRILAVIFGEALVEEVEEEQTAQKNQDRSNPGALQSGIRIASERPKDLDEMLKNVTSSSSHDHMWQQKLLDRITRELGILAHQLCEHPGAFTAYPATNYSASGNAVEAPQSSAPLSVSHRRHIIPSTTMSDHSLKNATPELDPKFNPTLQDTPLLSHDALWGIEEEGPPCAKSTPPGESNTQADGQADPSKLEHACEDWERELDMKMVFRYIFRSLAGKIPVSKTGASTPTASASQEDEKQDASYRAAIIKQHHPLVARADAQARSQRTYMSHCQTNSSVHGLPPHATMGTQASLATRNNRPASTPVLFHQLHRPGSSCASQSTLLSSKKGPLGSGSSRHYWDIGGSVGSGSAIVTVGAGGMGNWGDI